MEYSIDYFINKAESIPEDAWTVRQLISQDNKQRCWYGHCADGISYDNRPEQTLNPEWDALDQFNKYLPKIQLVGVNDDTSKYFPQPTPKQRIIAALYYIKQALAVKEAEAIINTVEVVEA